MVESTACMIAKQQCFCHLFLPCMHLIKPWCMYTMHAASYNLLLFILTCHCKENLLSVRAQVHNIPVIRGLVWTIRAEEGVVVTAAQLQHRLPCWGYVFQEMVSQRQPGRKVVLLGDTCDSEAIVGGFAVMQLSSGLCSTCNHC